MLKRTVLYQHHVNAGARMVEFAGWEMPVQYMGVLREYDAVRSNAGIFDASHMGEIEIKGPGARYFANSLLTHDLSKIKNGEVVYSLLLNERGGTIDDLLVYCVSEDHFLLVVNASNTEKDLKWIKSRGVDENVKVKDRSDDYALLAVQGPKALKIFKKVCDIPEDLEYYHFIYSSVNGVKIMVSRTGYTGEDGVEIFLLSEKAAMLWEKLLDAGKDEGLEPCGLAARDLLRIEAGYILYGQELDENIDPITAGLKWAVKKGETDFIGKAAIEEKKPVKKRIGFVMEGRAAPRQGYAIYSGDTRVGTVTSGTFSPSLQKGVGMGYISQIEGRFPSQGDDLFVEIREKKAPAKVSRMPFVKHSVHRSKKEE